MLGRKACIIYSRPAQSWHRVDGYRGHSPFTNRPTLKEFTYFRLIKNEYPYKGFREHYLLVPKREVETILDLSEAERLELVGLIGMYEAQGYTTISHQFGANAHASVSHKHIHLLK